MAEKGADTNNADDHYYGSYCHFVTLSISIKNHNNDYDDTRACVDVSGGF